MLLMFNGIVLTIKNTLICISLITSNVEHQMLPSVYLLWRSVYLGLPPFLIRLFAFFVTELHPLSRSVSKCLAPSPSQQRRTRSSWLSQHHILPIWFHLEDPFLQFPSPSLHPLYTQTPDVGPAPLFTTCGQKPPPPAIYHI